MNCRILILLPAILCAGQAMSLLSQTNTPECFSGSDLGVTTGNGQCPATPDPDLGTVSKATSQFPGTAGNAAPAKLTTRHPGPEPAADTADSQTVPRAYSTMRRPPLTRSEFELFAEDEAGQSLSVYGRRLFEQVPTTFAPLDHIPVPANYVIGPGDELLIHAWGKISLDAQSKVNRNGQIFLPRIGTLTVAGLRYDQLEGFLHAAIGSLYKGFDITVTLGQLRSIQVYVLGSARQPGAYTISSLSTLVNALFASGGPSATGTFRRIELRREDRLVTEFDIYDLLRRGDTSHDVRLLPGDVIYIPPAGPQIAILGSVKEPGIYELKGSEPLESALKEAGGLTNLADGNRVLLERIDHHQKRMVDTFALDAEGLKKALGDGDLLRVYPISPRFENAVTLRGNVAQPGRFLWHEGMRISDLIPSRQLLLTRTYWNQQNFLTPEKKMHPFASATNTASGQAQTTPRDDTSFEAARNGEEINWDYAAIERLDDKDLSTRLIAFNLRNAIDNPQSTDNQVLQAGDVVTIFSQKDIPLPVEKHAAFVRVDGEVNAPGVYRISPGETLQDVVRRAGGLTPHSYLYGSQLTRVSTRLAQELEIKESTAQMERDLLARNAATAAPQTANVAEQQAQLGSQQALISRLASVRPSGRITLGMKSDASRVEDIPTFPLEDGDTFYVPPELNTVQVSGAVYNESGFRYDPRKRLSSYLNDAGGPTRQADTKRIFLIRADGTVVSRQTHGEFWRSSFEKITLMPGDTIIVPLKFKGPNNFLQQIPYYTQMISQTALTGAVLGTSY